MIERPAARRVHGSTPRIPSRTLKYPRIPLADRSLHPMRSLPVAEGVAPNHEKGRHSLLFRVGVRESPQTPSRRTVRLGSPPTRRCCPLIALPGEGRQRQPLSPRTHPGTRTRTHARTHAHTHTHTHTVTRARAHEGLAGPDPPARCFTAARDCARALAVRRWQTFLNRRASPHRATGALASWALPVAAPFNFALATCHSEAAGSLFPQAGPGAGPGP